MHNIPMPILERDAIAMANTMLAVEMGHVAAAIYLYEKIVDHYGTDGARRFLEMNGQAFPILAAMADEDGTHRIRKHISDLTRQLSPIFCGKTDILCIGAEAAWLDVATRVYGDKIFHIVPHSNDANLDRFLSNYDENVQIHNSVDITHLYGKTSIVVTFAYNVSEHTFYTYPVVYRICGQDTRQGFSELIALDLIDCPLKFHPTELAWISNEEMTYIFSQNQRSTVRRMSIWKSLAF